MKPYQPSFLAKHKTLVIWFWVIMAFLSASGVFIPIFESDIKPLYSAGSFLLLLGMVFCMRTGIDILHTQMKYLTDEQTDHVYDVKFAYVHRLYSFGMFELCKTYIIPYTKAIKYETDSLMFVICAKYPEDYFSDEFLSHVVKYDDAFRMLEHRFPKFKNHPIKLLMDF